ncbi:MAG: hypothetical protein VKL41_12600 [Snowella sp.]|nr:hypothetical protein [Snowella sp.]
MMKTKLRQAWIIPKFFSLSCFASLTLGCGGWFTVVLVDSPVAIAQISQIPLTLSREPDETYPNFVQRATRLVTTRLKNDFSKNSSLNEVRIVVIGQNNGNIAPVLSVNMSRRQWLSNPNPQPLINYFSDSEFLLGFDAPVAPVAPTPQTAIAAPTNPTTPPPDPSPPVNNPPSSAGSLPPDSETPNNAPTNSFYNRFRGVTTPQPQ